MLARSLTIAIALVAQALSQPASACQGTKVLLEDQFNQSNPAWGTDLKHFVAQNGKLEIRLLGANHWFNQTNVYGDADVCAKIALNSGKADAVAMGLVFWGLDDDHYYTFEINPNGEFAVFRKVASGRFISPISWSPSPDINKGVGAVNELEVATKGNRATVYVNGKKLGEISGQPPASGSLVGLYVTGPEQAESIIEVRDFRVAE